MNTDLNLLQPYPFEKLKALKAGIEPPSNKRHIALSIGEPKHQPPKKVMEGLSEALHYVANYSPTKGSSELRQAIASWAIKRFQLSDLNPETQILPVNGTREALFAFAQTVINREKPNPIVVAPNPFYQIYEGAALLAGAQPHWLPCTADNDYLPQWEQVPENVWQDCQLVYLCTPGNPSGAVMPQADLEKLIELADRYDFVIASDECYSELYFDENNPPLGLLQVCQQMGRTDYHRCVVFHSLSKRSNLPGLRSGFVAGDANILNQFLLYRTYHGCAMPLQVQKASEIAWDDESHVLENRDAYRRKFDAVLAILNASKHAQAQPIQLPDASFYIWLPTPISDIEFAQRLFSEENMTVLPGSFLGREVNGLNPSANHVRIALVATEEECLEAAHRLKNFLERLNG